MSTVIPLPERPNLEQLKKRARAMSREDGLKLSEAQLKIARFHGFASWAKLKQHLEVVAELTREPDAAGNDDFLALACLTYGEDSPVRMASARELLRADPSLARRDIWSAAATANVDVVRSEIAAARTQGGPFGWEPLMYLCYSRIVASEVDTLASAEALLDGGADPNVGYLWHGLPTPFTTLTGVLGSGEGDQPPHPHWQLLARLLLERGADANDAQGLYNRQFRPGTEHLVLLFEFGLGQGDGGPWQQRMGAQLATPTQMVHRQLRWAIHHDMRDRVQLFAERGVDLATPFADGRTPAEFAAVCGHTGIVRLLASYNVAAPELSEVDRCVAAILAGTEPDGDLPAARAARPSLVVQAAATGRLDAVRVAVAHGFDVNALGRADVPTDEPWQTALHTAVERDDIDMVQLLLNLGADKAVQDARFGATPRAWAEHFHNARLALLLGDRDESPPGFL
ncbi:MAG TPA: ankyrin repeat domain-containing protein [Acidimicrobiales bacterium]|nr:ankyrin repeat domain-containing protein [Acidimicrobiales bacterium]